MPYRLVRRIGSRFGARSTVGWYERSANAEPSLIYSGVFSVAALAIPIGYHYYCQATGKSSVHDMDDKPYVYSLDKRDVRPDLDDYDKLTSFYRSKHNYLSYTQPENSGTEGPYEGREEAFQSWTGIRTPVHKGKWELPEL